MAKMVRGGLNRFVFLACVAALVAMAFLLVQAPGRAEENITILQYDDRGRVTGFKRVDPSEIKRGGGSGSGRGGGSSAVTPGGRRGGSSAVSPGGRRGSAATGAGDGGPAQRFIEGEVLVANTPRDFERDVVGLGFRVLERLRLNGLGIEAVRLALPRRITVDEAMQILELRFPGVTTAVNAVFDPSAGTVKPASLARAAISWRQVGNGCGRGVRIGIIDGVVDINHPALENERVTYRSFHREGWEPTAAEHGTAIAGMMVGTSAGNGFGGILPGAELFAANIFGKNQNGLVGGDAVAILRALEWMIEKKVHVVNMSLAGGDHKLLRLALEKARRRGLVAVASVGNWGSNTRRAFPAALPSVIAVTGVNQDMRIYSRANTGDYIDFAAPGVRIWTAVPGGGKFQSGTSFATPFVSALVAVAVARGASANPNRLRQALLRRVVDLGVPGRDEIFGFGFIAAEPECLG